MRIRLLTLTIGLALLSCQKEVNPLKPVEIDTKEDSADQIKIPEIGIKFSINSGTRKQLQDIIDGMEAAGVSEEEIDEYVSKAGACTGRSICLTLAGTEILNGGVFPADETNLRDAGMYSFELTKLESTFEFKVYSDYILPADKAIVFEGGVFEMDADYEFPSWICEMYDTDSIVLHAGTYPVVELGDGTVLFNF